MCILLKIIAKNRQIFLLQILFPMKCANIYINWFMHAISMMFTLHFSEFTMQHTFPKEKKKKND